MEMEQQKQTTIQISIELRKKLKEIAAVRDLSYDKLLDDFIYLYSGLKFKNEREFSAWFEDNISFFGFKEIISKSTNSYPDYELLDVKGKKVLVELEFFSNNFIAHHHDPKKVDYIISVYTVDDNILGVPVLSLHSGYPISSLHVKIDENLILKAKTQAINLGMDMREYIAKIIELDTQHIKVADKMTREKERSQFLKKAHTKLNKKGGKKDE